MPKLWQAFRLEAPMKKKAKLSIGNKVKIWRDKQGDLERQKSGNIEIRSTDELKESASNQ